MQTRPFFWRMHEQPSVLNMGLFANPAISCRLVLCGFYLRSGTGAHRSTDQGRSPRESVNSSNEDLRCHVLLRPSNKEQAITPRE